MRSWLVAVVFAILLSWSVDLEAQVPSPEPTWLDYWRQATVALGIVKRAMVGPKGKEIEKNVFAVIGTGVLFGVEGKPPILVSAKHVIYEPGNRWTPKNIQLRFAWFEDRPVEDYLGVEVALEHKGNRLWMAHPTADLMAMPLIVNSKDAGRDTVPYVPVANFASSRDLYEGAAVMVLGYPGAVGSTFWTRALVRGGIVAWINSKNPMGEQFVVDSLLFPGNSGGPVFKVPSGVGRRGNIVAGDKVSFLGIVSQGRKLQMPLVATERKIEISEPTGPISLVAEQWIGVGVVEPAERVRELLDAVMKALTK